MKVGIAGFGVIGVRVAQALQDGIEGLKLEAVAVGDRGRAEAKMATLNEPVAILDAATLATRCDIIVECAPSAVFSSIAEPALAAGKILLTVSGAALMDSPELIDLARKNDARIVLATGALLGLDAVRAAAEGTIHTVTMVTRKPPKSLVGALYLAEHGISIDNLDAPLKLFEGSAREGARGFPANVNVAAALGLAGVGPDLTRLEIWADPTLERNTHTIKIDADSARFEMTIENIPTPEKPGTGRITALSVIAALRGLVAPLKVGT